MPRMKGTPNLITRDVRLILRDIIAGEIAGLPARLSAMEDGQRVHVLLKLLPYVIPRVESMVHVDMSDELFNGDDKRYKVVFESVNTAPPGAVRTVGEG